MIISYLCDLARLVELNDLFFHSTNATSFRFWAIVPWIVRNVLVHGDVVPDLNVLPFSAFGL